VTDDTRPPEPTAADATYAPCFLGEIRAFPFSYAPAGWATCDGRLLTIQQNTGLFSLIGTSYGGDGRTTFALPDLQGKVPMGWGSGRGLSPRTIGETAGADRVTLTITEMPQHSHALNASGDLAAERQPAGQLFAQGDGISAYGDPTQPASYLYQGTLTFTGESQPHNNLMPYLALTVCIAVQGDYPPFD
jgi:microcystin-dependent protein